MEKRTLFSSQTLADGASTNSSEVTLEGRACVAFCDVNENTSTGSAASVVPRFLIVVPQAKDEVSGNFVDLGSCTVCTTATTVAIGIASGTVAKTALLANSYIGLSAPLPRVVRFSVSHPARSADALATFSLGVQFDKAGTVTF